MGVSGDASRPGRRRSHTPVHPALPPCLLPVHPLYLPVPLQFSGMISQSQIDLGVVSRYFTFQVGAAACACVCETCMMACIVPLFCICVYGGLKWAS